ncbi:MAG: hypothetical protein Q8O32_02645 [bacterium]|nr:hypothetical protein [bacterium]
MSYQFNWPVYGHYNQLKFLQEAVLQDKLANTYLFYGPSGLGKKMVADLFVKSLYCSDENLKPCNHCQNCQAISKGTFLDLHKLGDREELTAENVRDFLHRLSLSRFGQSHKIAIVYGLGTINLFSANAMLKTLEEPPINTTIILIADSIVNLPSTVISRCQLLKFMSLSKKDMSSWLENFDFSAEEKETISNFSFGRPGLALKMMEDKLDNFKKACNFIIKLLSGNRFYYMQSINSWFELLKKEYPDYKVYELGNLTKQYLDLLEIFLRDLLWLKLNRPLVNELYERDLQAIANTFDKRKILENLLSLNKIKQKLNRNVSPQLLWENIFLGLK